MSNTKIARNDLWTPPIPIRVVPAAVPSCIIDPLRDSAHANAAQSSWWPNEQLADCESEVRRMMDPAIVDL